MTLLDVSCPCQHVHCALSVPELWRACTWLVAVCLGKLKATRVTSASLLSCCRQMGLNQQLCRLARVPGWQHSMHAMYCTVTFGPEALWSRLRRRLSSTTLDVASDVYEEADVQSERSQLEEVLQGSKKWEY